MLEVSIGISDDPKYKIFDDYTLIDLEKLRN